MIYCVSKGVYHRKLKLENILIQELPNGEIRVKIADWGFCQTYDNTYPQEEEERDKAIG